MNRSQLEHIIRASAAILGTDEFIVVGSQSVLGAYPQPPSVLSVSAEADLYPLREPSMAEILTATIGEDSHFHDAFGIYADGVSEATSTLPGGWRERLVKVRNENTGGATAWCLDPTDLAIAKHVAGRPKDLDFTAAMVRHGLVDRSAFVERLATVELPPRHRERILARFAAQLAAAADDNATRGTQ